MTRKYRNRSPRHVMEMIVAAIHDNKEGLSYLQLKRTVESKEYLNYPSNAFPKYTFRIAIKKLRHDNILKESKKRKRIPIEFTSEVKGKFPFISIPDTYMLREESIKRELNVGNRLRKNRPTKEISESQLERQQQLVQYFLIRAAYGITTNIRITSTSKIEAGSVEGLYYSSDKSDGHPYWYYPEDYFLLSEEKKREVRPIIYKSGGTLPGVSAIDLITKRDKGNDNLFGHIRKPTKKEALKAINELLNQRILTAMTREEISSTLRSNHDLTQQEQYSIMRSIAGETRYSITNKPLTDYVIDWTDLLGRILGTIGMILRLKFENVKELRDFYDYCHGPNEVNLLRNQIRNKINRREKQKIKQDINPIYLKTQSNKSLQQLAVFYGELILEDLAKINRNMEYGVIRRDYPLLSILLTRVKEINSFLQQVLSDLQKTNEEKEKETNYNKKLRDNKQDFEKWKHISFG